MTRVVVRPRIKLTLLMIVSIAVALPGLSYVANGGAERTGLGIGLGGVATVVGALGMWRALRLAVVIDQSGLRVRRFVRPDQLMTWADVQGIACEKVFLRGGRPFYAPVLQVGGLGRLSAVELGSATLAEAEQNAASLRGMQAAAQGNGLLVGRA